MEAIEVEAGGVRNRDESRDLCADQGQKSIRLDEGRPRQIPVQIMRGLGIDDPPAYSCVLSLLAASRDVRSGIGALMGGRVFSQAQLTTIFGLYAVYPLFATAADLANHAAVTCSCMAKILDGFQHRGYIVRQKRCVGSRVHFVRLTDEGRDSAVVMIHLFLNAVDELSDGFSPIERVVLADLCKPLAFAARSSMP